MFGKGNGDSPLFSGKNPGLVKYDSIWPDLFCGVVEDGAFLPSCGVVNLILVENCWMNCGGCS